MSCWPAGALRFRSGRCTATPWKCSASGVPDSPGVSLDTSALFSNLTGGGITLLSVAVIPVAGWDTPLLVHIGVIRRVGEIGEELGWPPLPFSPGRFQDATVGPGVVDVAVGLSAAQPGVYSMNGIRIAYLDGARVGHVSGGPAELVCVYRAPGGPACPDKVWQRFQDALPGP